VPRQPYLPHFADKQYAVGFDALKSRPAFAEKIGECMGLWSYVDNELGGLFGILIGSDSPSAHRVFLVLRRWSHQREALNAAAEGRLSGAELETFHALLDEYRNLEAQRNDLAHGCFGICEQDDDLLFVINVEHHVTWQADIIPKHLKGLIPADSHQGLKEKMYFYRMRDLESLHGAMTQLWWDMFDFNGYLRGIASPHSHAVFQRIFERRVLRSGS
jgi:hypothetical protein